MEWSGEVLFSDPPGGHIVVIRSVEAFPSPAAADRALAAALGALNRPAPEPVDLGADARTGKVKWYNPNKGFGFIVPDEGGQDVFVHASVVKAAGILDLVPDQAVSFTEVQGPKGPQASAVSV